MERTEEQTRMLEEIVRIITSIKSLFIYLKNRVYIYKQKYPDKLAN